MANGSQSMPRGPAGGVGVAERRRRERLADPTKQIDYPDKERQALEKYTSSSSVNKHLGLVGYDNIPNSDPDKDYINTLDIAISKSGWPNGAKKTGLIRGGGAIIVGVPEDLSFSSADDLADYINSNIVNKKVAVNDGYTSITNDDHIAKSFAKQSTNPIVLHYDKIAPNTHGAFVSGGGGASPISVFGSSEQETVLERGIATHAKKAWVEGSQVHVSVAIEPTVTYFWE